jgi:dihydrodipicolinate synthase/N-acetylneuraminate lyase
MSLRQHLLAGQVIPAHPLALTSERTLDERRQRALTRYYVDAGAGGLAVGVHTTQFAIRDAGLYRPVLELAIGTVRGSSLPAERPVAMIAGVVGDTRQAVSEAETAASLGYDLALVSLGALAEATERELVAHCASIGEVLPVFGFYLQPAVGGRELGYSFWRELAELQTLWAIKIAPFDRYRTIDVVRAIAAAGRNDVALYTGNDDNIIADLLTPFPVVTGGVESTTFIAGGLLGQWAVWTRNAVRTLERVKAARGEAILPLALLSENAALTESNAAIFDAAQGFAGCIPGIHEILRRQGLFQGTWTLDERERLSAGQAEGIERVCLRYPQLSDDEFVRENLDRWMG